MSVGYCSILDLRRKELGQKTRVVRRRMRSLQTERLLLKGQGAGISIGMTLLKCRIACTPTVPVSILPVIRIRSHVETRVREFSLFQGMMSTAYQAAG